MTNAEGYVGIRPKEGLPLSQSIRSLGGYLDGMESVEWRVSYLHEAIKETRVGCFLPEKTESQPWKNVRLGEALESSWAPCGVPYSRWDTRSLNPKAAPKNSQATKPRLAWPVRQTQSSNCRICDRPLTVGRASSRMQLVGGLQRSCHGPPCRPSRTKSAGGPAQELRATWRRSLAVRGSGNGGDEGWQLRICYLRVVQTIWTLRRVRSSICPRGSTDQILEVSGAKKEFWKQGPQLLGI